MQHLESPTADAAMDERRLFRDVMGHFPTGVAVVTAAPPDGPPIGVTVNSLTSVSLEPRLILFCLDHRSRSLQGIRSAGSFVANILSSGQGELAVRFSRGVNRFDDLETETWDTGAPVFSGAVAIVECRIVGEHDGGDHAIVLGQVGRLHHRSGTLPLTFYRGQYVKLHAN